MLTLKSRMTIVKIFIRERNLLVFLGINIIIPTRLRIRHSNNAGIET
jgi:hypothetical protein